MSGDILQLLVLCAVAAVVLYRLKSVIGTRTGYEAPPEQMRPQPGKPVAVPVDTDDDAPGKVALPENGAEAMAAIRQAEPDFSLDQFLDGARGAYEMILMAYEEGDRKTLKALLAPDVFDAFQQGIAAREEAGLRVEARFIGVRDARVEQVEFDPTSRIADVTIRFVGEMITAVHDAENHIVEGDPNEVRRQTDLWTFSREMGASDPNWLLTATGD